MPISKSCASYLKKKKNTIHSSLERKPWATFPAPVSMGPYTGLAPICQCLSPTGGTQPFPVSRCGSPEPSREDAAFPEPAACTPLGRADLHRCLQTSSPPRGPPAPLQCRSPSTSAPSLFSTQYLPCGPQICHMSTSRLCRPSFGLPRSSQHGFTEWNQLFL